MDFYLDGMSEILKLEGDLNIQRARHLKDIFLDAFGNVGKLSVDIEGVSNIDIACLQVLCSAHRTFVKSDKKLTVAGHMNASLREAIHDAGYDKKDSCLFNLDESCLLAGAVDDG